MGGLVNLIKKLFSGIFSFIGGLLGGGKSGGGYYLELDEAQSGKTASAPKQEENQPAEANGKPAAAPVATIAAPAKVETASLNGSKPAAPANPLNLPQPTVSNFASEYLAPKPTAGRRRPGANMSSYLEMAKNMKTANN